MREEDVWIDTEVRESEKISDDAMLLALKTKRPLTKKTRNAGNL